MTVKRLHAVLAATLLSAAMAGPAEALTPIHGEDYPRCTCLCECGGPIGPPLDRVVPDIDGKAAQALAV